MHVVNPGIARQLFFRVFLRSRDGSLAPLRCCTYEKDEMGGLGVVRCTDGLGNFRDDRVDEPINRNVRARCGLNWSVNRR